MEQKKDLDFQRVQQLVDKTVDVMKEANSIDFTALDTDARDYALSQLNKVVGKLGRIVLYGNSERQ